MAKAIEFEAPATYKADMPAGSYATALSPFGPLAGVRGVKPITFPSAKKDEAAEATAATAVSPLMNKILQNTAKLTQMQVDYNEKQTAAAEKEAKFQESMGPLYATQAGMAAGSQVQPTTSSAGAVMQTVGAGISGAATGAMMTGGNPIGAVAGGLAGLVSGGIQSYVGLTNARQEKRDADKQWREIQELNKQARKDMLQQVAFNQKLATETFREGQAVNRFNARQTLYNNRSNAIQQRWNVLSDARNRLNGMLASNEGLRQAFIKQAR